MKDQIIALLEAIRLVRLEIERCRGKTQSLSQTADNVERIVSEPGVLKALDSTSWYLPSPPVVPDNETLQSPIGYLAKTSKS